MNSKILITSLLLASAFYSNQSFAQLAETKKELLLDIKEETKRCVIQIISINNKDKDVTGPRQAGDRRDGGEERDHCR